MTDYLPKVTNDDVLRIVTRDFESKDHQDVFRLLDEYRDRGAARVHLAILKLSDGRVDEVRRQVGVANQDYRDVISPAEYPGFSRVGFVAASKMTPEARESLQAADWQQYQAWLTRT